MVERWNSPKSSMPLTVDGQRKMLNAVQKFPEKLTYGELAHKLTNNEFVQDSMVKVSISITQVS